MQMNRNRLPLSQKGQALVLGIFLVLATVMTAVLMYNNGQTTTEKSRLVNAADAALYEAKNGGRNQVAVATKETAALASQVAGRELKPELAADLYRETGGNPLFIIEMVRRGGLVPYVRRRLSEQPRRGP